MKHCLCLYFIATCLESWKWVWLVNYKPNYRYRPLIPKPPSSHQGPEANSRSCWIWQYLSGQASAMKGFGVNLMSARLSYPPLWKLWMKGFRVCAYMTCSGQLIAIHSYWGMLSNVMVPSVFLLCETWLELPRINHKLWNRHQYHTENGVGDSNSVNLGIMTPKYVSVNLLCSVKFLFVFEFVCMKEP